jgi:outer membrane protein OmpA-like peptidoglycan-associated protein
MKKLLLLLTVTLFISCFESSPKKKPTQNLVEDKSQKSDLEKAVSKIRENSSNDAKEDKEETSKFKPNWSNPFMSPYGKPIINIIRAYFLVGEFDLLKKFIVNSDCFDKNEFEYLLRNSSWGYKIDATNMKWQKDSTFLMTAKSDINQTIGMEQYLGKIVNDTAKIFLFSQNKENPFVFNRKNPSAEVQCKIESLARTIDFDYNSSNLTSESKKKLKLINKLVSSYSNLNFLVNGHTSNEGTDSYNLKLSIDRAKAVRLYLITLGIHEAKINANGFGSTSPIYSGSNIELRSKNRRVEISILNK